MTFKFFNIKRIRFNPKKDALESEMLLRTMNETEAHSYFEAAKELLPKGERVIMYTNIED